MVEREVVRDDALKTRRLKAVEFERAARHFQNVFLLLQINRQVADRPNKSSTSLLPMKDLTGIERHREIEIRSWNFCELHVRKSCAAPKFCHLRSTWTRGSRSTQSFYSPISSASSHWDFGPDDEIETWTNSLSVALHSVVGCACVHHRRGNERRYFSGDAG